MFKRAQHEAAFGEECVGVGRGLALVLRKMDQHEVRHARRYREAEFGDFLRQPVAPLLGMRLRHLLMRGVLDRRHRRQHRRRRDVERPADAVHRIDDMGRPEHPADAQRGETVDLREGVGHHGVFGGRHQFDADLVVVARHVIGIGGVEHQQHMRRQSGAQPLDLVERQIGPGRVVRVGEPHQFGARRDQFQDRIDVGGEIGLGRDHVDGAVGLGRDRIHQKAVGGGDRLVAMAEIDVRQQIEDFVGAGAADDAVGIEPEGAADRLAQHARGSFRIILQMRRGFLVDRDGLRRRAERRLVGGQLEHLAARLRHRALARRVGRNIENAGIRHGSGHLRLRNIGRRSGLCRPARGHRIARCMAADEGR